MLCYFTGADQQLQIFLLRKLARHNCKMELLFSSVMLQHAPTNVTTYPLLGYT